MKVLDVSELIIEVLAIGIPATIFIVYLAGTSVNCNIVSEERRFQNECNYGIYEPLSNDDLSSSKLSHDYFSRYSTTTVSGINLSASLSPENSNFEEWFS
jgi:hypothetical protein